MIEGISAVTLGTHEMPRALRFYRALGFEVLHGDEQSSFTSLRAGMSYLNLVTQPPVGRRAAWNRDLRQYVDAGSGPGLSELAQRGAPPSEPWGQMLCRLSAGPTSNER
jgi:catechol 2,3-dioxygenase-like lactoylglutathione lyase family enzyme